MKSVELLYKSKAINFLFSSDENDVMVNATEMAKIFDKRIDVFLKSKSTKNYISVLKKTLKSEGELPPNGGSSELKIIEIFNGIGTFFHRMLALKFAAWLDPNFEVWIYTQTEELVYGFYKKHHEAHILQEEAKAKLEKLKIALLDDATSEMFQDYLNATSDIKRAAALKRKAIEEQYKQINQLTLNFKENY